MVKYSPETVAQMIPLIEAGAYAIDACLAVGIGETTYYEWLKAKPEFRESIKKARAKAINIRVLRINKAGQEGNWQADAWWLERVVKKRFGRADVEIRPQTNVVLGFKAESAFMKPAEEIAPRQLNAAQLHSRKIGAVLGKKAIIEGKATKRPPLRPRKKT